MKDIIFILLANIFASCHSFIDPGKEMMMCVDRNNDVDSCAFRTFEVMRDVMEVGVPELNIPVLEPVFLGLIDFKFYNLTVQFIDVSMKGFKTFKLLDSHLNKTSGLWRVSAVLPKMSAAGSYKLFGSVPPNVDLGYSAGAQRFTADKVTVEATLALAPKGDGVQVTDVKIGVDLEGIYLEMECLFPRNGKCCPKKYLKSCNTILTKTILRFINTDGKRFVKDFQQEISDKVKYILLDHLNNALSSVKTEYLLQI